jgi:hypothetical protein
VVISSFEQRETQDRGNERGESAQRRGEVRADGLDRHEVGVAAADEVQHARQRQQGVVVRAQLARALRLPGDEREDDEQRRGDGERDDDEVVGRRPPHATPNDGRVQAQRRR